ncbi:hypothetical protein [Burkholderia ubonensis]|uniref:hypothetical protein n=1 Tax=Burkholderia ubonensis TaxID=101571 RepID=UPI00075F6340|nr:hypothetical protein [Burkholderia ubonensis]KVP17160.1 hypothetical protein WJ84_02450 [Burkholderia ubonensis]KVP39719.1 hypothetical protein WJ87_05920 [Burkholderia ubonensis]
MKELKDNEIAALVNALRDVAVQYHGTQQLRERISRIVNDALGTREPAPAAFEAFMTAEYGKSFARASFSADAMRTCWMAAQAAVVPPASVPLAWSRAGIAAQANNTSTQ